VAKTLGNLANVYSQQVDWGKANDYYKQSLVIFGELRDRYGEAQTLANMGILHIQQSHEEKAVALWQEALTKLPSDLPKSKRVAEWLQSINVQTSNTPQKTSEPPRRIFYMLGFVMAITLFLLFLFN
jgi:tetratricopeptide (TPR) repeat protein